MLQVALLQQRAFVRALSATARDRRARSSSASMRALPFARTPDQIAVGDQIAHDLEGDWPMNRLVQGEVGSGKTLVALRAMLQVAAERRPVRAHRADRGARRSAPPLDRTDARARSSRPSSCRRS